MHRLLEIIVDYAKINRLEQSNNLTGLPPKKIFPLLHETINEFVLPE